MVRRGLELSRPGWIQKAFPRDKSTSFAAYGKRAPLWPERLRTRRIGAI
jgi:hypothetical protein